MESYPPFFRFMYWIDDYFIAIHFCLVGFFIIRNSITRACLKYALVSVCSKSARKSTYIIVKSSENSK